MEARGHALLGCPKSEGGRLRKLERATEFSEGEMRVPYMYVWSGGSEACTAEKETKAVRTKTVEKD